MLKGHTPLQYCAKSQQNLLAQHSLQRLLPKKGRVEASVAKFRDPKRDAAKVRKCIDFVAKELRQSKTGKAHELLKKSATGTASPRQTQIADHDHRVPDKHGCRRLPIQMQGRGNTPPPREQKDETRTLFDENSFETTPKLLM